MSWPRTQDGRFAFLVCVLIWLAFTAALAVDQVVQGDAVGALLAPLYAAFIVLAGVAFIGGGIRFVEAVGRWVEAGE